MAARLPRRSFASPFVVTLAACSSSSAPPTAPPSAEPPPKVAANPPDPSTTLDQPPPPQPDPAPAPPPQPDPAQGPPGKIDPVGRGFPKTDRHWQISKSGDACRAFNEDACKFPDRKPGEPIPACNPPPPQEYRPCPPGLADGASLIVVQAANQPYCVIQRAPTKCPPVCNPPSPVRVACPR